MSILQIVNPVSYELKYSPYNKYLDEIVQMATSSLKLDGYEACANAADLQQKLVASDTLAGIQFDDSWANLTDYPEKFSFALRFPSELRTSASNLPLTWLTMKLTMPIDLTGPRNPTSQDGGLPVGYLREGFIPVQHALSMAYMELVTGRSDLPEVTMQRYPYPEYIYDPLLEGLASIMSLIIILSFIYPCTYIVKVSFIFFNCYFDCFNFLFL